jgi:hypothetical protein
VTKNNIVILHNDFSTLSLSNDPTFKSDKKEHVIVQLSKRAEAIASNKQKRLQQQDRCKHVKNTLQRLRESKELFFNESITQAEDEQTAMAKEITGKEQCKAINTAHKFDKKETGLIQEGRSVMHSIGSALKRTVKRATGTKQVQFSGETQIHIIPSLHEAEETISVIYDSGVDGHYITEKDCKQAHCQSYAN